MTESQQSALREQIRQFIRDTEHYNRTHPDEPAIPIDDRDGSLADAAFDLHTDLDTLIRESRQ